MRKLIALMCILGMSFALIGCSSKGSKSYTLELEGNPTTGYDWTYTASEEGIVKEASSDIKVKDASLAGSPSTYTWTFEGLKEGTTTLTFIYSRSFEENSTEDTKTIELTVDKSLNITAVEK